MQDEVTVTQADEEHAMQIAREVMSDLLGVDASAESRGAVLIRMGILRYIARHQAERETLARMEPVAWMYEREGHQPQVSLFRWRDIVDGKLVHGCGDWTETPLYALPPAPEAGQ